jgi:hypothetical protein
MPLLPLRGEGVSDFNPFIAALKVTKLLDIGVPWPHGLQKGLNPFIAALKRHGITLHWSSMAPRPAKEA